MLLPETTPAFGAKISKDAVKISFHNQPIDQTSATGPRVRTRKFSLAGVICSYCNASLKNPKYQRATAAATQSMSERKSDPQHPN